MLANAGSGEAFDADATATTANGFLTYVNVTPGTYTLSFSHDTKTCVPGAGLEAEADDAITLIAAADALTYFSFYCFDLTGMQPAVITVVDGTNASPVEGATVCTMADVDGAECYTTDANGVANVMYEAGVDHVSTIAADGYFTGRVSYNVTPSADGTIATNGQQILPAANVETIVTPADGVDAVDETKGHVAIWAGNSAGGFVSGVTFTVDPVSGVGPQYFAEGNLLVNSAMGMAYDSEATATTSNGFANVINADPGTYTLTATHETATCVTSFNGIPNEDGSIGFDVAAAQLTYVSVICTE